MEKSRLLILLQDPSQANEQDVNSLQLLVQNYPYFQAARVLLAKAKMGNRDEIKSASVYTTNRFILQDIINNVFDTTHHLRAINKLKVEEEDLSAFERLSSDDAEDPLANESMEEAEALADETQEDNTTNLPFSIGDEEESTSGAEEELFAEEEKLFGEDQETDDPYATAQAEERLLEKPDQIEDVLGEDDDTARSETDEQEDTYTELMSNLEAYKKAKEGYDDEADEAKPEAVPDLVDLGDSEDGDTPTEKPEAVGHAREEDDETRDLRESMERIRAMREAYTAEEENAGDITETSGPSTSDAQSSDEIDPKKSDYAEKIISSDAPYDYPDFSEHTFDQADQEAEAYADQIEEGASEEPDFTVSYAEGSDDDTDLFADREEEDMDYDYMQANQFALNDLLDEDPDVAESATNNPQAETKGRLITKPYATIDSTDGEMPKNDLSLENQADLIEQFISKQAKLSSIDKERLPQGDQADLAYDRARKVHSAITENLAVIMQKQGKIHRAIEIYEQLQLKYPEKSDYFAAQISKLKQ